MLKGGFFDASQRVMALRILPQTRPAMIPDFVRFKLFRLKCMYYYAIQHTLLSSISILAHILYVVLQYENFKARMSGADLSSGRTVNEK